MQEVTRLGAEGMIEVGKRIERFRNQFLKERVISPKPELKAVGHEGA